MPRRILGACPDGIRPDPDGEVTPRQTSCLQGKRGSLMDEHHEHQTRTGRIPSIATASPPLAWYQPPPSQPLPTYAGFWRRFLAVVIDSVLLSFIPIPFDGMLESLIPTEVSADAVWPTFAVWFAASLIPSTALGWLYFALMESSSWQATLGKRALGVAVTDLAGNRISFGRATVRYFAQYLSVLTLGVGYFIQPFTEKRQTLHDMVSGTVVVRV
jgi:uncharacterized RDD family membrane protein YckC